MRSSAGYRGLGILAAFLILLLLSSEAPAAQPSYAYIVVRQGQTLWSIARAYGVSVETITRLNGLRSPDAIRAGQQLKIPVKRTPVRSTPRVTQPAQSTPRPQSVGGRSQFVWPARGLLTSRFGWRRRRHHSGIDIAAQPGSPIVAAGSGTVLYAGWYYSYGRTVIINHGNGWTTLYGHASSFAVQTNDTVAAGQLIARVGCTGRCTGPHVHFEIRVNGRALDPLTVSLGDPRYTTPVPEATTAPAAAAQLPPPAPQPTPVNDTIVHRHMTTDGPEGQVVQRVEDTMRDGQLVRRVQITTRVEDGQLVRIRKTYEFVNGALELRNETREVIGPAPRPLATEP